VIQKKEQKALNKVAKNNKSPVQALGSVAMLALQVGLYIGLLAYLGKQIDLYFELNKRWFSLAFVVIATVSGLFYLIKNLNQQQQK